MPVRACTAHVLHNVKAALPMQVLAWTAQGQSRLPARDCRVSTTASDAGSYGTKGCGPSFPTPYCCSASSRSDPRFPANAFCVPDKSGDIRGGYCPTDAYSHPACCHKEHSAPSPTKASTPVPVRSGNVTADSCQRVLTTASASGSFVDGCAPYAPYCCQGTRDQLGTMPFPSSVVCTPSAPGSIFGCTSGYFSCC